MSRSESEKRPAPASEGGPDCGLDGGASRRRLRMRAGQTMVEYVVALAFALAAAFAIRALARAVRDGGDRTLQLVSSEYP